MEEWVQSQGEKGILRHVSSEKNPTDFEGIRNPYLLENFPDLYGRQNFFD